MLLCRYIYFTPTFKQCQQKLKITVFQNSERRFIFFQAVLKQEHRVYPQSQKREKVNSLHLPFLFCLCEVLTLRQALIIVPDLIAFSCDNKQHSSRILRNRHNNFYSPNTTIYILWYFTVKNNYLFYTIWYITGYILSLLYFNFS